MSRPSASRISLSILATLVILYLVPFAVYGIFSALVGLQPPEGASPTRFLLSVLVSKTGTAVAFVLLFHLGGSSVRGRWLSYAGVWWVMYLFGEIGQAIGPHYSCMEAFAGVLSESIYFPLAAFLVDRWLGSTADVESPASVAPQLRR